MQFKQRFDEFIEKVLLTSLQSNIVILIDEIDSILSLNFSSEDFFAWIGSCYEKRTRNQEYKLLTFALLGVATPSNLIPDTRRMSLSWDKTARVWNLLGKLLAEFK